MFKTIMAIGAGSFLGGVCRYLLSRLVQNVSGSSFPFGTMTVNILGCLLVGMIYGFVSKGSLGNEDLKLFLTVGFCGGFTTFSTFLHENYMFLGDRNFLHFVLYATFSFALGLIAAHLGNHIARFF